MNKTKTKKIIITNALGQLINEEEKTFDKKTVSIDIKNLPSGIYFLNIENKAGETSRPLKFIKQ